MTNKQQLSWKLHGIRFALKALNKVNASGSFGHCKIDHGDKEAKRAELLRQQASIEAELSAV